MKHILLIFVMILLSGCQEEALDEPVKEKETHVSNASKKIVKKEEIPSITLVDQTLNKDIILILKQHPILYHYLIAHKDPVKAIQDMTLTPLVQNSSDYYIVTFAVNHQKASHLLLDAVNDRSVLVEDQQQLADFKLIASDTVLFTFSQPIPGATLTRQKIVAFNLSDLTTLTLTPHVEDIDTSLINEHTLNNYTLPVIASTIIEENHLQLTLPDLQDFSDESVTSWEINQSDLTLNVLYDIE